jgi:histidine triad (HIT) family protein
MTCIFCNIVKKEEEASIIFEDDKCIAFMDIRPVNSGQCMIIPKEHIDHFTDIPDEFAAHMMVIAQKIGRKMLKTFSPAPERIGYVVHGYGVFHAHLVIVPQHEENDITSLKMPKVINNEIVPDWYILPLIKRAELDRQAGYLKID